MRGMKIPQQHFALKMQVGGVFARHYGKITEPLQKAILSSSQAYSTETISQQHQNKQDVRRQIQDGQRLLQEEIKMSSSATSLRAIELAEDKGASSWLTACNTTS